MSSMENYEFLKGAIGFFKEVSGSQWPRLMSHERSHEIDPRVISVRCDDATGHAAESSYLLEMGI